MSKEAFNSIMSGLLDALAYAKGDRTRGTVHNPIIGDAMTAVKLTAKEIQALYHIDMVLWVQQQPWDDRFIPVIEDARTFRDALARDKYDSPLKTKEKP